MPEREERSLTLGELLKEAAKTLPKEMPDARYWVLVAHISPDTPDVQIPICPGPSLSPS